MWYTLLPFRHYDLHYEVKMIKFDYDGVINDKQKMYKNNSENKSEYNT